MTTQYISSQPPAVRHESDVIAYALSTLGYWPTHSLVFVLAPAGIVGPVLRIDVNLETTDDPEGSASVLAQIIEKTPALSEATSLQFFALFFGDTQHPGTGTEPSPLAQLADDQHESEKTAPYVHELHHLSRQLSAKFSDALFIGKSSYWGVLYPSYENVLVGSTQEILNSPLNTYFISEGQQISKDHEAYLEVSCWTPLANSPENRQWFKDARRHALTYQQYAQENAPQSHQQRHDEQKIYLQFWEHALLQVEKALVSSRESSLKKWGCFEMADHLHPAVIQQCLPEELAGYLGATMAEQPFINHLLYLAMTSSEHSQQVAESFKILAEKYEPEEPTEISVFNPVLPIGSHDAALENLCKKILDDTQTVSSHQTPEQALENLDTLARTITGNAEEAPSWQRLECLEILCLLLKEICPPLEKAHAIGTLAWISWLKGKSSLASYYLTQAKQASPEEPLILAAALQSSSLPAVALDQKTGWFGYHRRVNSLEKE